MTSAKLSGKVLAANPAPSGKTRSGGGAFFLERFDDLCMDFQARVAFTKLFEIVADRINPALANERDYIQ